MFKSRMMIAANSAVSRHSGQLQALSKLCKLYLFFFSVLMKICEMIHRSHFYLDRNQRRQGILLRSRVSLYMQVRHCDLFVFRNYPFK